MADQRLVNLLIQGGNVGNEYREEYVEKPDFPAKILVDVILMEPI